MPRDTRRDRYDDRSTALRKREGRSQRDLNPSRTRPAAPRRRHIIASITPLPNGSSRKVMSKEIQNILNDLDKVCKELNGTKTEEVEEVEDEVEESIVVVKEVNVINE